MREWLTEMGLPDKVTTIRSRGTMLLLPVPDSGGKNRPGTEPDTIYGHAFRERHESIQFDMADRLLAISVTSLICGGGS